MKINLKHSKSRWVDIGEGTEFLIDYPTIEQDESMKELQYQIALIDESLLSATDAEEREALMAKFTPQQKAQMLILSERLYKRKIKYCVKGFRGVTNADNGEVLECKLVNGEMEDKLFEGMVRDLSLDDMAHISSCIDSETELTETDKKKL